MEGNSTKVEHSNTLGRYDMKTLTIEYPDELELTLQSSADWFAEEARVLPAYKLFELGRLSSVNDS